MLRWVFLGCLYHFELFRESVATKYLTAPIPYNILSGAVFASVGALEALSQLVSNVTTSAIYAETVSYMRGLVFLVLGTYNAISLVFTV